MARIIQTADITRDTQFTQNENDWIYNGLDCCVTLEILEQLLPQLDNISSNTYQFSLDLQAPVLEMSMRGLRVDQQRRAEVLHLYQQQIKKIAANLDRIVQEGIGSSTSWRSPAQLKDLLYGVMQLPPVRKRNDKGIMAPTTNRDALEKLSGYLHAEPVCNHLLALRDLDKKRQFLETKVDSDGRMRCNFNIAGTNTGRLASSMSDFGTGTNLQNVDRELRSVFVADPGMKFGNLDLEQADARNVGAICWNLFVHQYGEAFAGSYLDACESGDLHTRVCKSAWTTLDWGDDSSKWRAIADLVAYRGKTYRDLAKPLGHGTNFYGLPPTMARHTKVDKSLIEDFQRRYFAEFPCIGVYDKKDLTTDCWHNRVRRQLKDSASLTTLLGRRRFFFGRHYDDETLRAAIAYEPQSLTADEIDAGIQKLWRANKVQLLVQVHDSILFQYPAELEDEIIPWALDALRTTIILEKGREFTVPTEAKVGWNWGDVSEANPDGLMKWKGGDDRKRQVPVRDGFSLLDL